MLRLIILRIKVYNIYKRLNMRTVAKIFMTITILILGYAGYPQTVASSYEVGTWPGFRQTAISYTSDDGCSGQFSTVMPMFDEFGFKLTLFTVTSWSPNWTALQNAVNQGYEIASQRVKLSMATLAAE